MRKKKKVKIVQVRLDQIKRPPIRHKRGLSKLLTTLVRQLFSHVGHLMCPTFEQWELGFMRGVWPWREVLVWEAICRTYDAYVAKHPEAANAKEIVTTITAVSCCVVFENDTDTVREIRSLFQDAWSKRWKPFLDSSIEFPKDNALVIPYENIVDKYQGRYDPSLKGPVDPRRAVADAEIILGVDNQGRDKEFFVIDGRDRIQGPHPTPGTRVLVISLDTQNTKTDELNKIHAAVNVIKGRYDHKQPI